MTANKFKQSMQIVSVAFALFTAFLFMTRDAEALTAKQINARANASLKDFGNHVDGAKEFLASAKAVLIMPEVTKAGFMVGGQYGEGVLRIGGKTKGYYNLIAGSMGFTIGAEKMDIIIAFMTDKALKDFQKIKGWEAGVDGNIALIDIGGGRRIDSTTLKDAIVGFVFDPKGLMLDFSLKGAKFTRIRK